MTAPSHRLSAAARLVAPSLVLGVFAALGAACSESATDAPPAGRAGAPDEDRGPRPDLVLVSIDTCRADRLSCYGWREATTPVIDGLAAEGLLFEDARTTAPITLPAHASLLTGSHPPAHGVRDNNDFRLAPAHTTVAERLAARGYRSGAFVGAFVLHPMFGLGQGFEVWDAGGESERETVAFAERPADEVARAALAWLATAREEPVFLFAHFYDPHVPYDPPADLGERFDEPYAAEIAAADRAVGRLVDGLREHLGAERADRAWVIVTSDHGEGLGEHGETTHGFLVHDSTLRVPLVVRPPGGVEARRIDEPVSIVDVPATLLAAAGLAPETDGVDLARFLAPDPRPVDPTERLVYSESLVPTKFGCSALFSVVAGGWKYVHAVAPELYDLAADPGETASVLEEHAERAASLAGLLERLNRSADAAVAPADGTLRLDDEARRALGGLGYAADLSVSTGVDVRGAPPKSFLASFEEITRIPGHLAAGRHAEVLAICDALDARHPGLDVVRYYRGRVAFGEGRFDDAAEALGAFLAAVDPAHGAETRPDRIAPYVGYANHELGQSLLALGRAADALAPLERAILLEPQIATAHLGLGRARLALGRRADAIAAFAEAARLAPDAELEATIGRLRREDGDDRAALEHFRRAVELNPDFTAAHVSLARTHAALGHHPRAAASFRRALELVPSQPEVRLELANVLARADGAARDLDGAVALVDDALAELRAPDARALYVAADVVALAGDAERAVALATEGLERARTDLDGDLERLLLDALERYRAAAGR